jgi:acyl-CoA thioesterase
LNTHLKYTSKGGGSGLRGVPVEGRGVRVVGRQARSGLRKVKPWLRIMIYGTGTGKDPGMDDLKRFVDNDRFAKYLGIEMLEQAQGKAKGRLEIRDHHLNSAGTVHGAAIFALADAVFSAASNSRGTIAMAINVSISYFKAVSSGILTASAEEVSLKAKLATYLIAVNDENGDAIALFQGTVYRRMEGLPRA